MKVSRRNLVVKLGAASVAGAAMSVAALPKAFAQGAPAAAAGAGVVNIYSSRHYGVESVFETFTRETGIRVRFTSGPDAGLRERIRAEAAADLKAVGRIAVLDIQQGETVEVLAIELAPAPDAQ